MTVILPPPPPLNELLLGRQLAQIAGSPLSGATGEIAGVAVERLSYTAPHRNWYGTLDALLAGRLLADATPASWRYLLCDGDRGVGELEVSSNDQDPSRPFVAVHEGAATQLSIEALSFAESIPEIAAQQFEARFLRVPALGFMAIWLHREGRDLIVPVAGGGDRLIARHVYSETEVTQALLPRAHEASTAPGGRPGRR